jgi:hypothetical protein
MTIQLMTMPGLAGVPSVHWDRQGPPPGGSLPPGTLIPPTPGFFNASNGVALTVDPLIGTATSNQCGQFTYGINFSQGEGLLVLSLPAPAAASGAPRLALHFASPVRAVAVTVSLSPGPGSPTSGALQASAWVRLSGSAVGNWTALPGMPVAGSYSDTPISNLGGATGAVLALHNVTGAATIASLGLDVGPVGGKCIDIVLGTLVLP